MKGSSARQLHFMLKSIRQKTFQHTIASPVPSQLCQSSVRSVVTNIERDADRPYIPRRTLMYVPGHDPRKLQKIPKLGVDCAVLECEDGVAVNMKVGVCFFQSFIMYHLTKIIRCTADILHAWHDHSH